MKLGFGGGLPAGGGLFNPAILFANGEQGAWYDPSDLSTMFQDTAGTTPCLVDAVVGLVRDKSGRGNHASQSTAASKPILRSSGGRFWLEFDGTDDYLLTGGNVDLSATDKLTVSCGVRKSSDAATALICETSTDAATGGCWGIFGAVGGTSNYSQALGGSTLTNYNYVGYAGPITNVLTATFDFAGSNRDAQIQFRVNGTAAIGSGGNPGPCVPRNFAARELYIGRRAGSSLPLNGRVYGLIIRGGLSDFAAIGRMEAWINAKTGAF